MKCHVICQTARLTVQHDRQTARHYDRQKDTMQCRIEFGIIYVCLFCWAKCNFCKTGQPEYEVVSHIQLLQRLTNLKLEPGNFGVTGGLLY